MNNKIEVKRNKAFEIRIKWDYPYHKEQMLIQLQDLVFTIEEEIEERKEKDNELKGIGRVY